MSVIMVVMKSKFKALVFSAVVAALFVVGGAVAAPKFGGRESMNGYSLEQFGDFIKDWHFVTVRFRTDTGEMRLVYANDLAWKTLQAGLPEYPDGSAYVKIGIGTADDPAFTSSKVPSKARRYQVMVMDRKKHNADTAGWGYAIFDQTGKTFEDNPEEQIPACHACHAIVPERGYVFSQPMLLYTGVDMADNGSTAIPEGRIEFETVARSALSEKAQGLLPAQFAEVRLLKGELRDKMFQGTIGELRPTILKEVTASGMPTVYMNRKGDRFLVMYPDFANPCKAPDGSEGNHFGGGYTVNAQNGAAGGNIAPYDVCMKR